MTPLSGEHQVLQGTSGIHPVTERRPVETSGRGNGQSKWPLDGELYSWLQMQRKGLPQIGNSNSLPPRLSQSGGLESVERRMR